MILWSPPCWQGQQGQIRIPTVTITVWMTGNEHITASLWNAVFFYNREWFSKMFFKIPSSGHHLFFSQVPRLGSGYSTAV